jgi:glycosyltransferase involved in cell wall biosynthesis
MPPKVTVVMPAYNAELTLEKTYNDIPKDLVDEIILVDDCSQDRTSEVAQGLGIRTIRHEINTGYGGNQKTCYTEALKRGADIIIMIHADYQYDPTQIPAVLYLLLKDDVDVAYGSRMMDYDGAIKGRMPLYKRLGNIFLTGFTNLMLGSSFTDAATGFIAHKRHVLETIPFMLNDDGYTFDEQAIAQSAYFNFRMKEFPILTRYDDESSSISFRKCIYYGFGFMKIMVMVRLQKMRMLNSPMFRRQE